MKHLIIAAALAVAFLAPAVASSSDDWADKAFTKDEQARLERLMQAIQLSAECQHYRVLMDDTLEEKNKEGPKIAKATRAMAYDVYGKMFDAMLKNGPTPTDIKATDRDFFIGMMFGVAMEKGEAEGFKRMVAEPMGTGQDMFNMAARRLYRERNCNLLPRAK
jgi:hypothetical protein